MIKTMRKVRVSLLGLFRPKREMSLALPIKRFRKSGGIGRVHLFIWVNRCGVEPREGRGFS